MDWSQLSELLSGFANLTPGNVVMVGVGGGLIYLAIKKQYEPLLLIPIGAGAILTNIPLTEMWEKGGIFGVLYQAGIATELFPLVIFLGLGALTDFGPLLENPKTVLLGAAAQFGIFGAFLGAMSLRFPIEEAASIGIIGSADGPTTIYLASKLAPHLLGPIAVAAYSYMAMVPLIQPPIMRLLTTKAERQIKMPYTSHPVSKTTRALFPIVATIVIGLIAPRATPLIGMLMFGNLMRECGVVARLAGTAQNELINIVTILLGLTVGSTMMAANFLTPTTIMVFILGLTAFAIATATGVIFGKLMCLISGRKLNPLIGAAGVSAVPMSARVAQKMAQDEDSSNFLLMHAMGPNVAGVIGSAIAAGAILTLIGS